jgi:hypothetical protein
MIDTNGFLVKYQSAKDMLIALEKDKVDNEKELEPYYKTLAELEDSYSVQKARKKELIGDLLQNKRLRDYYYFRSLIDGIYNLLKKFSWKAESSLFNFLKKNFSIQTYFEEGFEVWYAESACEFTPDTSFTHEVIDLDTECLVYFEYDINDQIKLPIDLDIYKVLLAAEDFLNEFTELETQKMLDNEYQEYVRLKEKYEGKAK